MEATQTAVKARAMAQKAGVRPIALNDYLNRDNVWARRLLGLEEFQKVRDDKQIEAEYNGDNYGRLVGLNLATAEEYRVRQFEEGGSRQDDTTVMSFGDELFEVPLSRAQAIHYRIIQAKVEEYRLENVCELGCGYGHNLSHLGAQAYGGEYSENAVAIAQRLGLDVRRFDYYDADSYSFLRPNSTVVTIYSIEQIPHAAAILEGLRRNREKIRYGVHFEPSYLPERRSLLGLLRNKYIEINDYNRDWFRLLKEADDVEVLEYETDVVSFHPLNPASLIAWRFRR